MKLSDLKWAAYNPRRISDSALKGLGYSLKEFGDLSGIVFNSRTGNLVAGHQRVKALREQYGDLPIEDGIIRANGNLFFVRMVNWPPEKERAANITANSPTIQGEFTEDLQILMEIDPKYCDIIIQRWENFTGKKAVLIDNAPIPALL